MKIIKKTNEKIILTEEISEELANAIRRTAQEIPILAIEEAEISKNDSVLYDEIIAHRLGMVPLETGKAMKTKKKDEKGNPLYEAKLKLVKKGPATVYSGDLEGGAKPIHDKMPITILNAGQEIELIATATLGKAIDHSKYAPGLIYYRPFYDISTKKNTNFQKEIIEALHTKLITSEEDGEIEIDKHTTKDGTTLKQFYDQNKELLEVKKGKGLMIFIESFGQISAEEMLLKSIEFLKENLKELSKK